MQAVKLSVRSVESCRAWQRRVNIYSMDQLGPCGHGGIMRIIGDGNEKRMAATWKNDERATIHPKGSLLEERLGCT